MFLLRRLESSHVLSVQVRLLPVRAAMFSTNDERPITLLLETSRVRRSKQFALTSEAIDDLMHYDDFEIVSTDMPAEKKLREAFPQG